MTKAGEGGAGAPKGHVARYTTDQHAEHADARLSSPVFPRNSPPLIAALAPWLSGRRGPVLEVGCGTGQHAAAFELAFPSLTWHASDPYPEHRASAEAWREQLKLAPRPALALDAREDWAARLDGLGPFEAVFSANVIHIAPVDVMHGILRGAGTSLVSGGLMIFYGPFREGGVHTGDGNARFDAGLRADNPDWGLRDVDEVRALGRSAGLEFAALVAMPADNRLLILRRG